MRSIFFAAARTLGGGCSFGIIWAALPWPPRRELRRAAAESPPPAAVQVHTASRAEPPTPSRAK